MHPLWQAWIGQELNQTYFQQMLQAIAQRENQGVLVFPPADQRLAVFDPNPRRIRVVILGQDPYIRPGQAHGYSFSVPDGVPPPPSLRNIFKEIASDIPGTPLDSQRGCLMNWSRQGVFLLNAVLTVEEGESHSHKKLGWEQFTTATIQAISDQLEGVVFLLWGKHAQKKAASVDRSKHLVLEAPHPSGLSSYRGFFGCRHFSQANAYLVSRGHREIDWSNR